MKRLFQEHGVATAPFEVLPAAGPVEGVCARLGGGPLIVKPDVSSASCGITLKSKVWNDEQVRSRRDEIAPAFHSTELFVEKFLGGEEFTVFVGGYWDVPDRIWTLPPARRAFAAACPAEERFLSYERYWGLYQDEAPVAGDEPFYHYERVDAGLGEELRSLAAAAFGAVRGHGYARVDIRQDTGSGELCVLEVNANCGLSEDDQTSTGSILALNGWSYAELLGRILEQTIERGAGARAAAVVARA
jgi:D-alanine-D-alanine ligase